MMKIRSATDRGSANFGWLDTRYTFSFANYYNPAHMGFRNLRVINEDWIAPGAGFGKHPHRDMEIITYVLEGALAHKDSAGHTSIIKPGEVQRMSAGSGIYHSEYNHAKDQKTHLLQIWIEPKDLGIPPGYEQKDFRDRLNQGGLVLLASPDGRDGSISINQDVCLHAGRMQAGGSLEFQQENQRHSWVQVTRGALRLNDKELAAGDGAALTQVGDLSFQAESDTEFLLFDLA